MHIGNEKPSYYGHRERLRNRFVSGGIEGFAEHEILEMALFYTIRRIDTKQVAKDLIKEFGSLEKVFMGSRERIAAVILKNGRPAKQEATNSAFFISFLRALSVVLWRKKAESASVYISNGTDLIKYLEAGMKDLNEEQMRIIYINNANKIIKDELLSTGTEDQTAVYPKKIIKRALELNATGIIVVHNHPAGSLKPSSVDINVTKNIVSAADIFSIRIIDHLIIGNRLNSEDRETGYFSFRESGLL